MTSQLQQYVESKGADLVLPTRRLTVAGISGEGDLAVATFEAQRASYLGVLCVNSTVAGKPGAEVWSVVAGRRQLARFAIHAGALIPLSR